MAESANGTYEDTQKVYPLDGVEDDDSKLITVNSGNIEEILGSTGEGVPTLESVDLAVQELTQVSQDLIENDENESKIVIDNENPVEDSVYLDRIEEEKVEEKSIEIPFEEEKVDEKSIEEEKVEEKSIEIPFEEEKVEEKSVEIPFEEEKVEEKSVEIPVEEEKVEEESIENPVEEEKVEEEIIEKIENLLTSSTEKTEISSIVESKLENSDETTVVEESSRDFDLGSGENVHIININKSEVPQSSENQPAVISVTTRTLHPTSWKSCCGLFEVFRRSER